MLASLAYGKFEELYEIEEAHEIEGGLHWAFGWDFSPLFSVPFFGLRAFGKLLVLLCFFALEGGLAPVFGPF